MKQVALGIAIDGEDYARDIANELLDDVEVANGIDHQWMEFLLDNGMAYVAIYGPVEIRTTVNDFRKNMADAEVKVVPASAVRARLNESLSDATASFADDVKKADLIARLDAWVDGRSGLEKDSLMEMMPKRRSGEASSDFLGRAIAAIKEMPDEEETDVA